MLIGEQLLIHFSSLKLALYGAVVIATVLMFPGGLVSLLTKAGLPVPLAGLFRCALDVARQTPLDGEPGDIERRRIQMIERILTQTANLEEGDIAYLLRRLGVAIA